MDAHSRKMLRADLVATSRGTKSTVAHVLEALQAAGLLNDTELGLTGESRQLSTAVAAHANAHTPYGKVVQTMALQIDGEDEPYVWEFVHPCAFLWYLTSLSESFAGIMEKALSDGNGRLSMALYCDELKPGNPMRSDKGRQAVCVYYTFLEWPVHLLCKKDAWLIFGALRTRILESVAGGASALMVKILNLCLVDGSTNLAKGFFITRGGSQRLCRSAFAGFIADEKQLKEIYDIKGQAGVKPCISCQNVVNFIHKDASRAFGDYIIGLDCVDRRRFVPHTDESLFAMHDRLEAAVGHMTPDAFQELERQFGVNYNPLGVLACKELRNVFKPLTHYIRDWQHTLVAGGVADTTMAATLWDLKRSPALRVRGIGLENLERYSMLYQLPWCHGKVSPNWFREAFFSYDSTKHFASDVMAMYPLLEAFMEDVLRPHGLLIEHIDCISTMHRALSLLIYEPVVTPPVAEALRRASQRHRELFVRLFNDRVKVKFHHWAHLPEDLARVKKCISCFPMERKHKDYKRFALPVSRSVEHTTTTDFVNYSVQEFAAGRFRFEPYWLENPVEAALEGIQVETSLHAHTPAGEYHRDDVVLVRGYDGEILVGAVNRFFAYKDNDELLAELLAFTPVDTENWRDWDTSSNHVCFVSLQSLRANLIWCKGNHSRIRVLIPPALRPLWIGSRSA